MMDDPIKKLLESTGLSCDELLKKLQDYKSSVPPSDDDLSSNSKDLTDEKFSDVDVSGDRVSGLETESNRDDSKANVDSTSEEVEEFCDTLELEDDDSKNSNSCESHPTNQTVNTDCDKCNENPCYRKCTTVESVLEETIPKHDIELPSENYCSDNIVSNLNDENDETCSNLDFCDKQTVPLGETQITVTCDSKPSQNISVISLSLQDEQKAGTSGGKIINLKDNPPLDAQRVPLKSPNITKQVNSPESDLDKSGGSESVNFKPDDCQSLSDSSKTNQKNIDPDEICCNEISSTELDEDEPHLTTTSAGLKSHIDIVNTEDEEPLTDQSQGSDADISLKSLDRSSSSQPDEAVVSSSIDNEGNNKTDLNIDTKQNEPLDKDSRRSSPLLTNNDSNVDLNEETSTPHKENEDTEDDTKLNNPLDKSSRSSSPIFTNADSNIDSDEETFTLQIEDEDTQDLSNNPNALTEDDTQIKADELNPSSPVFESVTEEVPTIKTDTFIEKNSNEKRIQSSDEPKANTLAVQNEDSENEDSNDDPKADTLAVHTENEDPENEDSNLSNRSCAQIESSVDDEQKPIQIVEDSTHENDSTQNSDIDLSNSMLAHIEESDGNEQKSQMEDIQIAKDCIEVSNENDSINLSISTVAQIRERTQTEPHVTGQPLISSEQSQNSQLTKDYSEGSNHIMSEENSQMENDIRVTEDCIENSHETDSMSLEGHTTVTPDGNGASNKNEDAQIEDKLEKDNIDVPLDGKNDSAQMENEPNEDDQMEMNDNEINEENEIEKVKSNIDAAQKDKNEVEEVFNVSSEESFSDNEGKEVDKIESKEQNLNIGIDEVLNISSEESIICDYDDTFNEDDDIFNEDESEDPDDTVNVSVENSTNPKTVQHDHDEITRMKPSDDKKTVEPIDESPGKATEAVENSQDTEDEKSDDSGTQPNLDEEAVNRGVLEMSEETSNTDRESESESSDQESSKSGSEDEIDENLVPFDNEDNSADVSLEDDNIRNSLKDQLNSLRNRKKHENFKIDSKDVLNKVVHLNPRKKLASDKLSESITASEDNEQEDEEKDLIEMSGETNLLILDVVGGIDEEQQQTLDFPETQNSEASETTQTYDKIKLTKTNDITKIKGWKNKKFSKDIQDAMRNEETLGNPVEELRKIISRNRDESKASIFSSDDDKKSRQSIDAEEVDKDNESFKEMESPAKSLDTSTKISSKTDDKISPFVSNELDDFLNSNSSLQISYDIPKLDAEEGLINTEEDMVHSTVMATEMKDNKELIDTSITRPAPEIKAKTLAEKRRLLEKMEKRRKKQMKKLGIKGEIKNEENDNKSKMAKETRGYVLFKNKKIWLRTKGGNAFITKISDKILVDTKPLRAESYRRPSLLNELQRKSIEKTKYKPAPLSKKVELYNKESNGCWKSFIKKMPIVYLEIIPEMGKKFPTNIQQFLPKFDWKVNEIRANYALTALHDKKNKFAPKHFFKIPLQYANNQNSVIVKKKIKKYDKKLTVPNIFEPVKKRPDSVEDEIKDIINDLLNYIETKEIEDSIIKKAEPYSYDESCLKPKQKPNEINENISTIVRKASKKRKIDMELLRLNCKVVNVTLEESDENNCKKPYCQLGCVCQSLRCENVFTYHCRKLDCMFECTCPKQKAVNFDDEVILPAGTDLFSSDAVSKIDDRAKRNLAKVEREFTQTIIYANDKTIVVSASGRCKPRRATRVPKKYTDYLEEDETEMKNAENKSDLEDPKLKQKCDIPLERLNLNCVIPYCLTHEKYNCSCGGTASYIPEVESVKKENVDLVKGEPVAHYDRSPVKIKEIVYNKTVDEVYSKHKVYGKAITKENSSPKNIPKDISNDEPSTEPETCARFKPVFTKFCERNKLPLYTKKLMKFIRSQDFLLNIPNMDEALIKYGNTEELNTDADILKSAVIRQYSKKNLFKLEMERVLVEEDPFGKVENKAIQRRKKNSKIKIQPVSQAQELRQYVKSVDTAQSAKTVSPKQGSKSKSPKKTKSKEKQIVKEVTESAVSSPAKESLSQAIFEGEVIIPVDNNPDFMKVLGLDKVPEGFIRILPWINLLSGYKSNTIKAYWQDIEPHKYIICSSDETRIPKHFIPIHKSVCAASYQFSQWISNGIFPIQKAYLYIVLVPFENCFSILAFCLNSFDEKNNAMITVPLKESTKADYLKQLKEAEALLLNKTEQMRSPKKVEYSLEDPSTSGSLESIRNISLKDLSKKQTQELIGLEKYVHRNMHGESCVLQVIQHFKGSAPLAYETYIEPGETEFADNVEDLGNIEAWLPRCDGRWRMIFMRSDFAYLTFTKSNYSIKYNDLKSVVKLSCTLGKTLSLHNKAQLAKGYQSRYFGIYVSHSHRDRIYIGPYGLDETHAIETYRYMHQSLVNTDVFNKMQGKPGNRIGIWLRQCEGFSILKDEVFTIPRDDDTIDLTDETPRPQTSPFVALPPHISKKTGTVAVSLQQTSKEKDTVAVPVEQTTKKTGTVAVPLEQTTKKTGTVAVPLEQATKRIGTADLPFQQTSKKPKTVLVSPVKATGEVKLKSILKRPSQSLDENLELPVKKIKLGNKGTTSLLPFQILPSEALEPEEYNRYIVTNIPHLGYIGAHLDERKGDIMIAWTFHDKTLKFDSVEKALAFLGTRLVMMLQPIPMNFAIKFLMMKSMHAGIKPIDKKYLYGHYICGEFGVFDVKTLTPEVLQRIKITREEVVDSLTKRVHRIISSRMEELKGILYENGGDCETPQTILTDARNMIVELEKKLEQLQIQKAMDEAKKNKFTKRLFKIINKLPQERRLVEYNKFKDYTTPAERKESIDSCSSSDMGSRLDSTDIFYASRDDIAKELPESSEASTSCASKGDEIPSERSIEDELPTSIIGPIRKKERNDDCIEIIDSDDDDCIPIEPEIPTIDLDELPDETTEEHGPQMKTLSQVFGDKTEDSGSHARKKLKKIKLKPLPGSFKIKHVVKHKSNASSSRSTPVEPVLSGVKLVKMNSGKLILVKDSEARRKSPLTTKIVIKNNKVISVAPVTEDE